MLQVKMDGMVGGTKTLIHAADGVVGTGVWERTIPQILCAAAGMGYTSTAGNDPCADVEVKVTHNCRLEDARW